MASWTARAAAGSILAILFAQSGELALEEGREGAARRFDRGKFTVENSIAVGEFQLGQRETLDYPALTREMFERTSQPL